MSRKTLILLHLGSRLAMLNRVHLIASADEAVLRSRQGKIGFVSQNHRRRLQGAPHNRRHHFDHGDPINQGAREVAVRFLKPARIDMVPDFTLEWVFLKRAVGATVRLADSDPRREDAQAPRSYRDRSSIRPIILQIMQ
jgi:hypothetical protein